MKTWKTCRITYIFTYEIKSHNCLTPSLPTFDSRKPLGTLYETLSHK